MPAHFGPPAQRPPNHKCPRGLPGTAVRETIPSRRPPTYCQWPVSGKPCPLWPLRISTKGPHKRSNINHRSDPPKAAPDAHLLPPAPPGGKGRNDKAHERTPPLGTAKKAESQRNVHRDQ